MLKRLFCNNYKCFLNFTFGLENDSSALLIGLNGSGKSSVREILSIFQQIVVAHTPLKELISKEDFGLQGTDTPMDFEIDVELEGVSYTYAISFDYPVNFYQPRIYKESLNVNGNSLFTRNLADVSLNTPQYNSCFSIDWHIPALRVIQSKSNEQLITFRTWIANMLLLCPEPATISGCAIEGTGEYLQKDASNLISWLSQLLRRIPKAYSLMTDFLQNQDLIKDFSSFEFRDIGVNTQKLMIEFVTDGKSFSFAFSKLSDGEKMLFLSAVVYVYGKLKPGAFCLWDEPNNYLSASTLDQIVRKLRTGYENSQGQFLAISHDLLVIEGFNDSNTWVFSRPSHLTATRPPRNLETLRKEQKLQGNLDQALLTGDLFDD